MHALGFLSRRAAVVVAQATLLAGPAAAQCPDYLTYSTERHAPFSTGRNALSYMRPAPECRTFVSAEVESRLASTRSAIADPDLARLFENTFPSTLDTAIKWKGVAADNEEEELTFVITGDINAMWLRDSSNQMQSYLPILEANSSRDSIASLYRGVINLQSRYLLENPYCNSFQPPVESNIPPAINDAAREDTVKPPYSNETVFECKYELDSLAAFLEVSANYHNATVDTGFFGRFAWIDAMQAVLKVATDMMTGTYGPDGEVLESPYTFTRVTPRATETLFNDGVGHPVALATGLIRSAFRPSDDSTIYQLFIPPNMMFASYLRDCAEIMAQLGDRAPAGLADQMRQMAASLREAITRYGIVPGQEIYAFEVDGFGSTLIMDDGNIPSLLAAPFFGYLDADDPVYRNTRAVILNRAHQAGELGNPYFMRGPVISGVGSPHTKLGFSWPMASIVRILTSDDDDEITTALAELVSSTDGLGLIHESVNTHNQSEWTRPWFSWANGLFGQMILDLQDRKPSILQQSFQ